MKNINSNHLLFLKLETVPEVSKYELLDIDKRIFWEHKTKYQSKDQLPDELYYQNAGLIAEFGKIICISTGTFSNINNEKHLVINTFKGPENKILTDFKVMIDKFYNKPYHLFCTHNGKKFAFPFIARRFIINKIPIPNRLALFGKKPWEVPHIDTMELWKFGDFKHNTSLALLANILRVPKTKRDFLEVNSVNELFYEYGGASQIIKACEQDLITIVNVYQRLKNEQILNHNQISYGNTSV